MMRRNEPVGPALFDLEDFFNDTVSETLDEVRTPVADLLACGAHRRYLDDDAHAAECWGGVCPSCGDPVSSGGLMRLNHTGADRGTCTSLGLRLNHLTYALRTGCALDERDLSVLALGWMLGPDGSQIPPAGRPAPSGWERHWSDRAGFAAWTSVTAFGRKGAA